MSPRRELLGFTAVLAVLVGAFFHASLFGGRVLSPADALFVSASFRERGGPLYEPGNRLLMDPVLQFQPWLEFNRAMLRRGRLPLWNRFAGCGAPHLANGQSAVFDPFHLLAYLGQLPDAYAWMAAARLLTAGVGMFVLARSWGFGPWGRWFAGMTFPFCGFLVAWLLYPVTNVAIWMPWLFWAVGRALDRAGPRSLGLVAVAVALVLVGGHVQTSAHVLLAAGLYALWRTIRAGGGKTALLCCATGGLLGVGLAAVEVIPLGAYLARSSVWGDRARERAPFWTLSKPRWADAVGTAWPYAFGSQRRGQPNLAHAVGTHNLNERAGGFTGLATLIWLAPLGWSVRRREPRAEFLAGLVVLGALGAFGVPPVDNILRTLPVLDVTDNRRLTLWIAFGLVLLGGAGMDALVQPVGGRRWRIGPLLWVGTAVLLAAVALSVPGAEEFLRTRALRHYAEAATHTPGADAAVYTARAERQVRQVLHFVPIYYGLAAAQLATLSLLAVLSSRGGLSPRFTGSCLLTLTLVDLFGFGFDLNPAITRADDRPVSAVIGHLQQTVGQSGRVIGLGEELPPNTLMRYGLADARNYDSVELARSLAWFAPLYEPRGRGLSSRGEITWAGVARARDRLEEASVAAVVAAVSPPAGTFRSVERVGATWIARLDAQPMVTAGDAVVERVTDDHGALCIDVYARREATVAIRQTFDPGWRASIDDRPASIHLRMRTFMSLRVGSGRHRLSLRYDPLEVRAAIGISSCAAVLTVFALTGFRRFRSIRIIGQGLGRP